MEIQQSFFKYIIGEHENNSVIEIVGARKCFRSLPCNEELVKDVWTVRYDHYDESLYIKTFVPRTLNGPCDCLFPSIPQPSHQAPGNYMAWAHLSL
ncbi:hypothetical protein L3X38_041020 [Prunus dulcis]|uniref:Uncharacterized protein n=1 Tax=Prunus dulcis TaxID=3755 RepID=A0AAD4UTW8_PRUDU|nr:hypothetical protein L3X38_041020 [Prunus dulcis]